jgi:hypothetical protein
MLQKVNFFRGSTLNHCESVALLDEVESEYGDIIYHINVRRLRRGSVLKRLFDLLNVIKLLMEKRSKDTEELSDTRCITDLALLVDVNSHLNNLNK